MPIYQLPNGKTIYLSIEEYLDLTEEDVQYLISLNIGESPVNPFHGSVINRPGKKDNNDDEFLNDGIDYTPENDDPDTHGPINLDDIEGEGIAG